MELINLIQIGGLILANGIVIMSIFINLNVKIAEIAKDQLALKSDLEEHKITNKEDVKELKNIILRDKTDNRDDFKAVLCEVATLTRNLADFKIEIIRAIQKI